MYFQLGCVRMYADFRVWCNNYGILAKNVNLVAASHSGAVICIAGDNWLQYTAKAVACSQRLT